MRGRFKQTHLLLLAMCLSLAPILPLAAQETATESTEAETPPSVPVPPEYASPQATLKTFLEAINKEQPDGSPAPNWEKVFGAIEMSPAAGDARQPVAWTLLGVFNGFGQIKVETMTPDDLAVSEENLAEFEFFPSNTQWRAGALFQPAIDELGEPPAKIVLVRTESGAWKFSEETLDTINELASWIEPWGVHYGVDIATLSTPAWFRSKLPDFLKGHFLLTLEYWQWFGLLMILLASVVVDFLSRLVLRPFVRRLANRYLGEPDEQSLAYTLRPIGLAIGAAIFLLLLNNLLGLTGRALTILVVAGKVVVIVGMTWAAWALTDLAADVLLKKAKATKTTFDDMLVPLMRKTFKLFIVAFGMIYVAKSLDIPLAPLLGSLGLAGLAISFAAQDIVKNLFGGVMIFLDKPFEIGERINFQGYDGVIEEIGFRTTRLRTLTGHLVTIPNGSITNEPVENIGRRPYIRRTMNIGITYDTPRDKIEQAVEIVRGILEEDELREPIHQSVGDDAYPPRVYFNDYADVSLNIIVLYWFMPPAYWDYIEHAQKFNLRLFEEFEKAGIEFAFPTQTLYLAGDPKRPLDIGRPAAT